MKQVSDPTSTKTNHEISPGILPGFLYIGVARAGSTWLFEVLREHPEIYVPPAKDIYFFDRYYDKGLAWYRTFFQNAGKAHAVGELSHDYYVSEAAADRILHDLPKVKLVCCLREPVECLISGYLYNKTMDVGQDVTLADYAVRDHVQHQFDYYGNLKVYFDRFDRTQLHVAFYDELQADPGAYARSIYEFLGVAPDFAAPSIEKRINPSRTARNKPFAQLTYRLALTLRRLGMANLVGRIKRSPQVNHFLYETKSREQLVVDSLPDEIIQNFRKDYTRLEVLIGRTLPESWHG